MIYIALLRGINVGASNRIRMNDLKRVFESIGLKRVQTYIQSGNILFEADGGEAELRGHMERAIETEFNMSIDVVLRTAEELKSIVANCPFSEEEIAEAKSTAEGEILYVSLMREDHSPGELEKLKSFDHSKYGGDKYQIVGKEVFLLFRVSIRNSKLAVDLGKVGGSATVRNWNTINKLLALVNKMEV